VKEIKNLQSKYKFFNIGYSNLSPEQFKQVKDHISYFEGLYNLENKINDDNGIITACHKTEIPFYAYQPLRRNRTAKQNYKEVVSLAEKYSKTQNQILINWMIKHKGIGLLIKASKREHIKENIEALNFDMAEKDYLSLDKFRNKEFDKIPFSYCNEEGKIRIDQIPNQPIGVL
jgi:diketogulonate reductase-like aldo/keto reductase